jgi:hypothetical protein
MIVYICLKGVIYGLFICNFVSQMQIVLAVLADLLFLDIHELINRNLVY